jgi:hypothetical protein
VTSLPTTSTSPKRIPARIVGSIARRVPSGRERTGFLLTPEDRWGVALARPQSALYRLDESTGGGRRGSEEEFGLDELQLYYEWLALRSSEHVHPREQEIALHGLDRSFGDNEFDLARGLRLHGSTEVTLHSPLVGTRPLPHRVREGAIDEDARELAVNDDASLELLHERVPRAQDLTDASVGFLAFDAGTEDRPRDVAPIAGLMTASAHPIAAIRASRSTIEPWGTRIVGITGTPRPFRSIR